MVPAVFDQDGEATAAEWARWLVIILGVITLFRIAALYFNATDLFFDEAQYWSWSTEPSFGYYSKPPLIAWLIALSSSVCGASEFCVRLPSPLLHMATGLMIFAIGTKLYDARVGFWSGLAFATLPGVSLSAGIISTDVPLLLLWAAALLGLCYLFDDEPKWWAVPLLGLALGLGLNAKYAMAYFVLCAMIYLLWTPKRRSLLGDRRLWIAVVAGLVLIAPNIVWNLQNGFATFAHTTDNAKWGGVMFRPHKAVEFFGAQFGVFGPILFAALLIIALRWYKNGIGENDRLLFAFAAPVIVIVTVQAFLSRAHANWAAVSYVSATVLVTATMIRDVSWGWLRASLILHTAILIAIALLFANAGSFRLPNREDPFSRTLGWQNLADETRKQLAAAEAAGQPFGSILTLDRSVTAELIYYLRDDKTPVRAWMSGRWPRDHYQLKQPYRGKLPDPVLLVAVGGIPFAVGERFETIDYITVENIPAGAGAPRRVIFARLSGYKR